MVSDGLKQYRQSVWDAKRAAILRAARDIVLGGRLAAVTMAEVALEASVSTATLYKHFASREVLFEQVIETACLDFERSLSNVPASGSPREALRQFFCTFVALHSRDEAVLMLRAAAAEAMTDSSLMNGIGRRMFEAGCGRLERVLERFVDGGALDAHDIGRGARQVLGMIREELVWPALLDTGFEPPVDSDTIIDDAIETYLARYGAREPVKTARR